MSNLISSFDLVCDVLYDLKESQRDNLVSLLTSRLWHYEGASGERLRFEHLFELHNESFSHLFDCIDSETLAFALKLGSPELKNRVLLHLQESKADALSARMKALGPIRWSEAEEAESVVMSLLSSLVESGDIELAPIHRVIGHHTRIKDYPRVLNRSLEAPVRTVLNMADSQLSYVLREVDPVPWADFIGYAGDVRLLRKVLFNCTRNMADQLLNRLDSYWPDVLSAEVPAEPEPLYEELLAKPELLEPFIEKAMHPSPIDLDTLGIAAAESVLRAIDQIEGEGRVVIC